MVLLWFEWISGQLLLNLHLNCGPFVMVGRWNGPILLDLKKWVISMIHLHKNGDFECKWTVPRRNIKGFRWKRTVSGENGRPNRVKVDVPMPQKWTVKKYIKWTVYESGPIKIQNRQPFAKRPSTSKVVYFNDRAISFVKWKYCKCLDKP